uniref:Uncharacterized protein n=1 Tax=Echeneis naucrates TaxID=173247 RepID=A0A665VJQ9_ECHNA
MKGNYSLLSETPEMERVRANQRHLSSVHYREEVGRGTAVMETPEMERVRRNQDNISSMTCDSETPSSSHQVKYKQNALKATSVGVTPELERVRQNQENISSARHTHTHTHSCVFPSVMSHVMSCVWTGEVSARAAGGEGAELHRAGHT